MCRRWDGYWGQYHIKPAHAPVPLGALFRNAMGAHNAGEGFGEWGESSLSHVDQCESPALSSALPRF